MFASQGIVSQKIRRGRKILERSSEKKNHNGGEKTPLKKLRRSKMQKLRVRISKVVADFKKDGYPLVFPPRPKNGPFVIFFNNGYRLRVICLVDLTPKSLNVETTFYKSGHKAEIHPFDSFLKSLEKEETSENGLKKELIKYLPK